MLTLQSRNLITWLTPLYTWQKDAMNWKTPKLGWKFYRFLNLVLKNRKYFFPTTNFILILHSFFLIEFSFSFIMLSSSPTLTGNYFVSIFFNIVILKYLHFSIIQVFVYSLLLFFHSHSSLLECSRTGLCRYHSSAQLHHGYTVAINPLGDLWVVWLFCLLLNLQVHTWGMSLKFWKVSSTDQLWKEIDLLWM